MGKRPVLDHVWTLILPLLERPIPAPLSRPERSELAQSDLASLCLVCKLFNEICRPILYTRICTDRLPLLLSHIHLPSNRKLFSFTRSLYIEYYQKDDTPGYATLCRRGGQAWEDYGAGRDEMEIRAHGKCEEEAVALTACLKALNEVGAGETFSWLETIAVASIYRSHAPTQHYHAARIERNPRALIMRERVAECSTQFLNLLGSLSLKHLCLRDTLGPITFPNLLYASNYSPDIRLPITTFHLPFKTLEFPIPLGYPVRYTSDGATKGKDWAEILKWMEACIWKHHNFRPNHRHVGIASDHAEIEIYCSTETYTSSTFAPSAVSFGIADPGSRKRILSASAQAKMTERLGDCVQGWFRRDSGLQDNVKWRISAATPTCGSCGSGPPGRET